ncbi:hypothetical protein GT030_20625 [Streptomyces sp. SID1328]|uniref:AbiTii domain-containing protein n=1 Tax=Streptomyces sp. SID1328 TaxID=2690250 RepID=UPI00136C221E|nr:hypothetical protein [Streptomyces sp. SID1328]
MATSDVRGLEQLERAVLDDTASLASALRQFLMAGYAHHEELRAWALKELEGYPAADELPSYRKVPAALEVEITLNLPGQIIQGNTRRISVAQLPRSARERGIGESAPIRQGVREIEALIAISDRMIHLSPPGSAEYALGMTRQQQENGHEFTEITSLYWAIAKPSVEGVLDHIRTRLTQFVAEVRAAMPAGQQKPDLNQIDSARTAREGRPRWHRERQRQRTRARDSAALVGTGPRSSGPPSRQWLRSPASSPP